MAFKSTVPITNTNVPVGVFDRFLTGVKNIPTHLHIGLFGHKTTNLPVTKSTQMFPGRGLSSGGVKRSGY